MGDKMLSEIAQQGVKVTASCFRNVKFNIPSSHLFYCVFKVLRNLCPKIAIVVNNRNGILKYWK